MDSASDFMQGLEGFRCSAKDILRSSLQNSSPKPEESGIRILTASGFKGIAKASAAVIRTPIACSFAFSRGLHNAPKLWGDPKIRSLEAVNGIGSGFEAGSKARIHPVFHTLVVFRMWLTAYKGTDIRHL